MGSIRNKVIGIIFVIALIAMTVAGLGGSIGGADGIRGEEFISKEVWNSFYDLLNGELEIDGGYADSLDIYDCEYLLLDLDGDHVDELLIRDKNAPGVFNLTFHYENGEIVCWQRDVMEETSVDYPLLNSTMVSEYHYGGAVTRRVYRFLPGGKKEEIIRLFAQEENVYGDLSEKCPCYEINGTEVEKDEYTDKFNEYIDDQQVPSSMWTSMH